MLRDLNEWIDGMKQERKVVQLSDNQNASHPLILLWNGYQEDDSLYRRIFHRMTSGSCEFTCRITRDKRRQNESSLILFHFPNLHWEGYNYPSYRNPNVPWVLMSYESSNSIRERASNWGRYPPLKEKNLKGIFNRTLTLRQDSDIVARHGFIEKRDNPLTVEELLKLYSQEIVRDFSNYTSGKTSPAYPAAH